MQLDDIAKEVEESITAAISYFSSYLAFMRLRDPWWKSIDQIPSSSGWKRND